MSALPALLLALAASPALPQGLDVPGLGGPQEVAAPGDEDAQKASATLWARRAGDELRIALEVRLAEGWHLYHGPTQEDVGPGSFATPTTLELALEGEDGARWSAVVYPAPKRIETDLGEDEPAITFEHEGTIVLRARGAPGPGAGADEVRRVRATVKGLTCSTETGLCIPYREELAPAGEGPDALFVPFEDPAFARLDAPRPTSGTGSVERVREPVEQGGDASLWLFLLAAVGWGLFTLLMPCTYPMIPITISFFTKQATQRERSAAPLALAYGAGIVAIFVLIGVVVGPVIIRFATHPVTNLVIGLLFLVFALALFGAIELRPPAFLMNAAGRASSKGGYLGVFLMGATLVVTSFTCTAPFVGSLLSLGASQGGVGRIALGMAVFGLTMAIPFVLLSLLPAKLRAIPRSGEWMHVLKVFLGFVEVAAALKFLSNTDLVWQWQVLSRELFLSLWAAIFFAAALFLFGMLRMEGESEAGVGPKRMLGGLASLLFAAYCAYGALGNSLDGVMTAIAPPYSNRTAALSAADAGQERATHAIVKDDYQAARELAVREKKGLLVNFTGYT
jgi:thiol:disulfide interchange protein DsbD